MKTLLATVASVFALSACGMQRATPAKLAATEAPATKPLLSCQDPQVVDDGFHVLFSGTDSDVAAAKLSKVTIAGADLLADFTQSRKFHGAHSPDQPEIVQTFSNVAEGDTGYQVSLTDADFAGIVYAVVSAKAMTGTEDAATLPCRPIE
jgi:hypothetical protein